MTDEGQVKRDKVTLRAGRGEGKRDKVTLRAGRREGNTDRGKMGKSYVEDRYGQEMDRYGASKTNYRYSTELILSRKRATTRHRKRTWREKKDCHRQADQGKNESMRR